MNDTQIINNGWIDTLHTTDIKSQLQKYLSVDTVLTFTDAKQLLMTAAQGGMTADKLKDLSTMWLHNQDIFSNDYVRSITGYVINGNPANTYWWNGLGASDNKAGIIGNITNNTAQGSMEKLINKWFSGSDVPMPFVGGDTAAGIAGDFKYTYSPNATGTLYDNGVAASDINQGTAATCYFLSSLGAIANSNPSLITDSFITDNKDGTFGFRFYNVNSEPVYVTVDNNLAVKKDGSLALAKSNTEMWVSLAEKAYAQLNSQNVLIRDPNENGINSYQAVEGGFAAPLKQITGQNYVYYSGLREHVADPFSSVTNYSLDPKTYKDVIIKGLENGSVGYLSSSMDTKVDGKIEMASGHAFMLLGYDPSTDTFKVRNPWGDASDSSKFIPEFNVSLEQVWNNCSIALTDPTIKNVDYSYSISSDAPKEASAKSEGDKINFIISRENSGTTSVVYYAIKTDSVNPNRLDNYSASKNALTFSSNDTVQNLYLQTFTDAVKEGVESFSVELYKSLNDTTPFATTTSYIKDAVAAKEYNYTISTTATQTPVKEGQQANFTITRSDKGSESTVYLSTLDGAAGVQNHSSLNKYAVTFKPNQEVAIVPIDIYTDSVKEDTKSFELGLYKTHADTTPIVKAVALMSDDAAQKNYNYTITSDASTQDKAIAEGSHITFTITRDGTGTASSIYLKNGEGSAYAGVDYLDILNSLKNSTGPGVDQDSRSVPMRGPVPVPPPDSVPQPLGPDQMQDGNLFAVSKDGNQLFVGMDGRSLNPDGRSFDPDGGSTSGMAGLKLTFQPDQKTLTFNVDVAIDNLRESIESLSINLYKDAVSNTPSSVATAYIKDAFETQYNYSITSNADNEDTAVEGGSDVTFTITRSGKGSTSTVFIETDDGTTDPYDYNFLNEQKVTFAPDQTTQTMTVKTYSDPNIIGTTTDFSLGLFQYASDTEYTDYSTAYIKNTTEEDDYAYEIDDVEVTQGGKASFTIHRDGSGSESTVYLFTEEDSATSKNFVPLEDVPVVFAANETEKTITVDTIKDNLTGEPVKKYLYLDLYKNHSDLEYETCGMGAIISDKLNKILGATKSDKLTGTQGQDTIDGGGGNDTITGSFGQDILNGGAGKDVFRFTSIKDSSVDMPDIVNDFTKGDKIDLSAIDANSTKVKDQAFTAPVIGDTFSGMFTKEGQLFFETSSETLYGNVNKDGLPDFAIKLSGVIKLAATDFVL